MLVIRLQRTGRKNLAAYRVVVAEKSWAVKKRFIDIVGHYIPTRDPKVLELDQEKILAWISKGARPSDTVASLCKSVGMKDMEKFMDPRNKERPKKNPDPEEETVPEAEAPAEEPKAEEAAAPEAKEEAPAEEPTPEAETPAEEPKEEAPAPEAKEEAPAEEPTPEAEAPAEEPKAEEAA